MTYVRNANQRDTVFGSFLIDEVLQHHIGQPIELHNKLHQAGIQGHQPIH